MLKDRQFHILLGALHQKDFFHIVILPSSWWPCAWLSGTWSLLSHGHLTAADSGPVHGQGGLGKLREERRPGDSAPLVRGSQAPPDSAQSWQWWCWQQWLWLACALFPKTQSLKQRNFHSFYINEKLAARGSTPLNDWYSTRYALLRNQGTNKVKAVQTQFLGLLSGKHWLQAIHCWFPSKLFVFLHLDMVYL